jgi:hypothetical protein
MAATFNSTWNSTFISTNAADKTRRRSTSSSGGIGLSPTWNSADKTATLVLSNADKTATGSGAAREGVRATNGYTGASGKYAFGITVNASYSGGRVGMIGSTFSLGAVWTINADAVVYAPTSGVVSNASTVGTANTAGVGDVVTMAIDFDNKMVWVKVNSGNWNNSGTANPATNTGGFSIASHAITTAKVAVQSASGDLSSFTSTSISAPTGFTAIN